MIHIPSNEDPEAYLTSEIRRLTSTIQYHEECVKEGQAHIARLVKVREELEQRRVSMATTAPE